ncbi:MAG TPA: hypothetical protein VGL11_08485 [Candidatus Binatia bacterium]|jgi:hypothetical protein
MSDAPKSKTDRILSVTATITAIASLTLAVWQGMENRRHNRLTIRPKLIMLGQRATSDREVGLVLLNKGTGPAVIKSATVWVDKEKLGFSRQGWIKTLQRLKTIDQPWVHYGAVEVLQAGESRPILWVDQSEWKTLSEEHRRQFIEAVRHIKVDIVYESIYNEPDQTRFDGTVGW